MIDIVYPVKITDDLRELRYSLRSIDANARGLYDNIWIITEQTLPSWLCGVNVVEAGCGGAGSAFDDVRAKLRAACDITELSDDFILMNDDFFLVEEIHEWEAIHLGPISEYLLKTRKSAGGAWFKAVSTTADWMRSQGHGDILAYQAHCPLKWNKNLLGEAIDGYPKDKALAISGLYPIAGAGGEGRRGRNSKIKDTKTFYEKVESGDLPWLSSNNNNFRDGMIGGYIMGMFTQPSRYERS